MGDAGCEEFLKTLTVEKIIKCNYPVEDLLPGSLFYPASGFDGGVVKDCNRRKGELKIYSFIYCDYGLSYEALMKEIKQKLFCGYNSIASRPVKKREILSQDNIIKLEANRKKLLRIQKVGKLESFFAQWTVYERHSKYTEKHGPERFSVLHICDDGIAIYNALYSSNRTFAKALAIIQPGAGYGNNWTDFSNPEGELANVILNNSFGQPQFIYYGGNGSPAMKYDDFRWEGYAVSRFIEAYYTKEPNLYFDRVGLWIKLMPVPENIGHNLPSTKY